MTEEVYIKEHLNDLENNEIQVIDDYKMKTPKGLPQGFFSLLAVGSSGSGKTNAVINLIEKLKVDKDCLNNIKYETNKKQIRKISKTCIKNIIEFLLI